MDNIIKLLYTYKYNHTNMLYDFLVEKNDYTQYIPFNRTIVIKQVRMKKAMIGIDLQKAEELVLLHNQ